MTSAQELQETSSIASVSCTALRGIVKQLQETHDMITDRNVRKSCEDIQLRLLALILRAESDVRSERSHGLSFNNLLRQ